MEGPALIQERGPASNGKSTLSDCVSFFSARVFLRDSTMEIQTSGPDESRDPVQSIFFNERGLRPGWRLAIFIGINVVITWIFLILVSPFVRPGASLRPWFLIVLRLLQFLIVIFASWVMSRIEGRDMGEYGLPLRNVRAISRFVRGFVFWGFLPLSLFLLVLRGLHAFYFGNIALHGSQIFYWGAVWGLLFILVGLHEEYALRGYALYALWEGVGFWPAAVILASVFGLLHTFNPGEARIGILMTVVFALFASVTLRYTGNLWMAAGLHAGWDWGESYFYGTNNSGLPLPGHLLNPHIQGPEWLNGGSVGPEGSALVFVLLILMTVLFALIYRRAKRPVLVVTSG